MTIRAYLDLSSYSISTKNSVEIRISGVKIQQEILIDNGRFFIYLSDIDPYIPKELEPAVTMVTSREGIVVKIDDNTIETGLFVDNNGSEAEVLCTSTSDIFMNLRIDIRAKSLNAWKALRRAILARKTRPTSDAPPPAQPEMLN